MWKYSNWNKIIKTIITSIFVFIFMVIVFTGDTEAPDNIDKESTTVLSSVGEQENTTDKISTTQESTTLNEITTEEQTTTQTPSTTQKTTTITTQTQNNIQETNQTQQPITTQEPDTTKTPTTTEQKISEMVWIPNSGKKYHSHSACSGMKNPSQVSLEQAKNMGYTQCSKCY